MPVWYFGSGTAKEAMWEILRNPPSAIAWDTETISVEDKTVLCFAFSDRPDRSFVYQMEDGELPRDAAFLEPIISNPGIVKVGQNWMFDILCFSKLPGGLGRIFNRQNFWDTNVAARVLGYEDTRLCVLAAEYGFMTTPAEEITKKHGAKDFSGVPIEEVVYHCNQDVKATIGIYPELRKRVEEAVGKSYFDLEMSVMNMAQDVASPGILMDHMERKKLLQEVRADLELYKNQIICSSQGRIVNPGSNNQVSAELIKRGIFLPWTESEQNVSTAEEVLEGISDPLARLVLNYRGTAKIIGTYLAPEEQPVWNLTHYPNEYTMDTGVGRFSSRRHNVQNIPGKDAPINLRSFLVPENGMWTIADYSRFHFYLLGGLTHDPALLDVLYNPDPEKRDIHEHTNKLMGIGDRKKAKTTNFAMLYGGTPETLRQQAKIPDLKMCEDLISAWFGAYPVAARWMVHAREYGLATGWSVPSVFGRKLKLPSRPKGEAERKAVNYPIICSESEVFKRGMIILNECGLGPPILRILVHDEYVFDGDVEVPVEKLSHIAPFEIPIDVEKCERWK
jgi:DNA polymerase-1